MPGVERVVMVTPRFHPEVGGVETHVYETGRRLVAQGVDLTVLTTDRRGALPALEMLDGIRVRRVRAWPADRDYRFAPGILRALARERCDVVHCQGYHTLVAPLAMLAAIAGGTPLVVSFHSGGHSSLLRHRLRAVHQFALRPLLTRARRLIAVSRFEVELFQRRLLIPRSRFVVIPNGAGFEGALPRNGFDGTVILSVGRLERYKGHHRAIAALPTILAARPDARLVIAGAGPYRDELLRVAARSGVADRVEIRSLGVDRAGMASLLSAASLVMLLSEYEAQPVSVLEAAALQRPALVTDTSGLRELTELGCARAVPADATPEAIGRAALAAIASGWTPAPSELPTWDGCAARLLETYREALG